MRAGSVTVAELIKNRPAPVRIPSADEAATEEIVTGLLGEPAEVVPSTHRRRAAKTRQLAKLAGLSVATAVLCGSVAAASIINTRRQAVTTDAAARPAIEMTVDQALLPSLFTIDPAAAAPERGITTGLPAPNTGTAAATVERQAGNRPPTVSADTRKLSGHPAPSTEPANAELVRQFYALLAGKPATALGLLDGVLRDSDLSRFIDSWSQVRNVQVLDVQQRADGTLLAIVQMVVPDGGQMRVQQLMRVTDTKPQRITGAEIISAQRS
jgi:hypothetical protein